MPNTKHIYNFTKQTYGRLYSSINLTRRQLFLPRLILALLRIAFVLLRTTFTTQKLLFAFKKLAFRNVRIGICLTENPIRDTEIKPCCVANGTWYEEIAVWYEEMLHRVAETGIWVRETAVWYEEIPSRLHTNTIRPYPKSLSYRRWTCVTKTEAFLN